MTVPRVRPLVSVIVPAYNAQLSLKRAVDSALNQTMSKIEVIIVDDGSSDDTLKIARRLAALDPRVQVITGNHRRGPAGARNAALEYARGEWIALLDADDAFFPERLERLVEEARKRNCDFIADNLLLINPSGAELGTAFDPVAMSREAPLSALELIQMDTSSSEDNRPLGYCKPVFRSAFISRNHLVYDTRAFRGQDFVFYLQAIAMGAKFCLVPWAGYSFTVDHNSHSSGVVALNQIAATNIRLLQEMKEEGPLITAALKRRRDKFAFELFRSYLRQRAIGSAILASVRVPPSYLGARVLRAVQRRVTRALAH